MDEEDEAIKEALILLVDEGSIVAHCPKCNLLLSSDELRDNVCSMENIEIDFEQVVFVHRDLLPEA